MRKSLLVLSSVALLTLCSGICGFSLAFAEPSGSSDSDGRSNGACEPFVVVQWPDGSSEKTLRPYTSDDTRKQFIERCGSDYTLSLETDGNIVIHCKPASRTSETNPNMSSGCRRYFRNLSASEQKSMANRMNLNRYLSFKTKAKKRDASPVLTDLWKDKGSNAIYQEQDCIRYFNSLSDSEKTEMALEWKSIMDEQKPSSPSPDKKKSEKSKTKSPKDDAGLLNLWNTK